jgi:hypothetical protein
MPNQNLPVLATLEDMVRSEPVALGLAVLVRVRRGLAARAERTSRHLLHALNLPAGSDIRRLLTQGAAVERQVQELGKCLEEALGRQVSFHAEA